MRPLVIDDGVRDSVKTVVQYAAEPENFYEPGISPQPPGDNARHVVLIEHGFRCVFSITKFEGKLYRHVSASVNVKDRYPSEFAAYTIAELFGFTGWDGKTSRPPEDWLVTINKSEHCVVIAQEI